MCSRALFFFVLSVRDKVNVGMMTSGKYGCVRL